MKFLADENIEREIVESLRTADYDVLYITEECPGCSDNKVLKLAESEKRILVTNDTDFGEMVFRQKVLSVGVILMRFDSESTSKKVATLKHLLKHHHEKLFYHFTVINERQIKIRPIG